MFSTETRYRAAGGAAAPDVRRRLRAYALAATAARTGDEMAGPALLLLGLGVLGSAAGAATMLACLTVAAAIGGPLLGAALDRAARPTRVLALALLGFGAGVALVAAALAGGAPLALPCALAAITGLAAPSLSAGWSSQLPAIVAPSGSSRWTGPSAQPRYAPTGSSGWTGPSAQPRDAPAGPPDRSAQSRDASAIERAYGLDVASYNAATLGGPAAVGALAAFGAAWPVVAAVALVAVAAPLALRLPAAAAPPTSADLGTSEGHRTAEVVGTAPRATGRAAAHAIAGDVAAGFRAIGRNGALRRVTVASTISFAGSGMLVVACPLIGAAQLGGESRGTALLSVAAAGSLLATAALARPPAAATRERRQTNAAPPAASTTYERRFRRATVLLGAALLVLALAPSAAVVVLGAALVGAAEGPQLAAVFLVRQREAPAALRSQIFTTAASLKLTAAAAGSLLAGALAAHSLTGCLAVAAALQLLATAAARAPS